MTAFFRHSTLAVLLTCLLAPGAVAQQRDRMDQGMRYDTTTVETLEGTIARIDTMESRRNGWMKGLHLQLDTGEETVDVHLGPMAYLTQQGIALDVGQTVRVRGARMMDNDAPVMLAAELHHGDQSWMLRETNGTPMWSGQRQGQRQGRGRMQNPRGNQGQRGMMRGQRGMGPMHYDTATVETLQGTVTRIDTLQSRMNSAMQGIHLQLDTGDETIEVHLGPLVYLRQEAVTLAVGNDIRVRGSRVTLNDAPALIAAELHHGDASWMLRDDDGRPKWRGMMRGQRGGPRGGNR